MQFVKRIVYVERMFSVIFLRLQMFSVAFTDCEVVFCVDDLCCGSVCVMFCI